MLSLITCKLQVIHIQIEKAAGHYTMTGCFVRPWPKVVFEKTIPVLFCREEYGLRLLANRAAPVCGKVFEWSTRRNAVLWVSDGRIVYPAAFCTFHFLHDRVS